MSKRKKKIWPLNSPKVATKLILGIFSPKPKKK